MPSLCRSWHSRAEQVRHMLKNSQIIHYNCKNQTVLRSSNLILVKGVWNNFVRECNSPENLEKRWPCVILYVLQRSQRCYIISWKLLTCKGREPRKIHNDNIMTVQARAYIQLSSVRLLAVLLSTLSDLPFSALHVNTSNVPEELGQKCGFSISFIIFNPLKKWKISRFWFQNNYFTKQCPELLRTMKMTIPGLDIAMLPWVETNPLKNFKSWFFGKCTYSSRADHNQYCLNNWSIYLNKD